MFPARRAFLFLQGPRSPFFNQLGQRLTDDGHKVVKVNFSTGDQAIWHGKLTETFRDPWPMLGEFIVELWRRHEITDQVAFDDCRLAHRAVIPVARRRGIRSHVLEAGYLHPHWVTLEREGANGYSLLPRDPEWYHSVGPTIPHALPPRPFRQTFTTRAAHDVGYHLAQLVNPVMFWQTRGHARLPGASHSPGTFRQLVALNRRRSLERCRKLIGEGGPFYLFPLQPAEDPRIRWHSSLADRWEALERVIRSFACFAPGRARLVVIDRAGDLSSGDARRLRGLARETEIGDRLIVMPGGDLNRLIEHASGLVTINGSEGLMAIESECPTVVLGQAIYRMPGLISPSSLDDFWRHPIGPDRRLFRSFAKVLIHATQINGGFFSREGIDLAVVNAVSHLTDNVSPIERLLWDSRLPVAS
ncbi:capsule biosynthesis protein CapA [Salinicola sp. CPA57]|uniref:capsular polysaccharide export protein, LipB/KpsS family n=1 Tax=Salinicola sp. CPA57 TaxID=1949080 RepID=UPI000DA13D0B|nr:capsule biosynthesis protein CapA [Salinicola sp. CPA57]